MEMQQRCVLYMCAKMHAVGVGEKSRHPVIHFCLAPLPLKAACVGLSNAQHVRRPARPPQANTSASDPWWFETTRKRNVGQMRETIQKHNVSNLVEALCFPRFTRSQIRKDMKTRRSPDYFRAY